MKREIRKVNANGITFIKEIETTKANKYYLCKCHCGREFVMAASAFYSVRIKSCGCLNKTMKKENPRLYRIWENMKVRCRENNPKIKAYEPYSGKGIKVCEQWQRFEEFHKWAVSNGYKEGLTIDRIDNSKGYSPDNCKWSDRYEQAGNKTNNVYITLDGDNVCAKAWCRENRVSYKAFMSYRYKHPHLSPNDIATWYLGGM